MKKTQSENTDVKLNEPTHQFIDDKATSVDRMGRKKFANNVASFIINSPPGASYRVGIYGEWGAGKTSVMAMIEKQLPAEAFKTLWFIPWTAKTPEELKARLLVSMDDALVTKNVITAGVSKVTNTVTKGSATILQATKELDPRLKMLDAVAAPVRDWVQEARNEELKKRILKAIEGTRLVVFIDDLDRTNPDLLPDLLLNLREALDLPNIYYVLGLSPRIVEAGLRAKHPGWLGTFSFLEKIVEYPIYLPEPTERELNDFARFHIGLLSDADHINVPVLEDLLPLLPRNPRRLKLLLRYLYSMRGQLRRFAPDEVHLRLLYLAQMLRLEFAEEAQKLFQDKQAIESMSGYAIKVSVKEYQQRNNRSGNKNEKQEAIEEEEMAYAPAAEEQRKRFMELCRAMKQSSGTSFYDFSETLTLLENPPLITHKESSEIFENLTKAQNDEERLLIIQTTCDDTENPEQQARHAILCVRLAEIRARLHEKIPTFDIADEQQGAVRPVHEAGKFIRLIFQTAPETNSGIFSADTWKTFQTALLKNAGYQRPERIYHTLRKQDAELLHLSDAYLPIEAVEELYPYATLLQQGLVRGFRDYDASPLVIKAIMELRELWGGRIAERVLNRFEQQDGVPALYNGNAPQSQRDVAYDAKSAFHTPKNRSRLLKIASTSFDNSVVQSNFVEYFETLAYFATECRDYTLEQNCLPLLEEADFIRTLWDAATVRPLGAWAIGRLKQGRERFTQKRKLDEKLMPEPEWYIREIETLDQEAEKQKREQSALRSRGEEAEEAEEAEEMVEVDDAEKP